MKTVKRREEEKDSGGSKEETANDGNHCSEVSVVHSYKARFHCKLMPISKFWKWVANLYVFVNLGDLL